MTHTNPLIITDQASRRELSLEDLKELDLVTVSLRVTPSPGNRFSRSVESPARVMRIHSADQIMFKLVGYVPQPYDRGMIVWLSLDKITDWS